MKALIEMALEKVSELNERTEMHCGEAPFSVVASDFAVGILFHDLAVWTDEDCAYAEDTGEVMPFDEVLGERLSELRNALTGALDDGGPQEALDFLEAEISAYQQGPGNLTAVREAETRARQEIGQWRARLEELMGRVTEEG